MPNYRLLKDAYYGVGGFLNGGYLVKFDRETDKNYQGRQQMAYYANYFANIVDALVNPIFKKPALRNYDGNGKEYVDTFLENIDNNETDISNFMKAAALRAKLFGAVFIVVDNFREIPSDMATAIVDRKVPYAYLVDPEYVTNYSLDQFGRLSKLEFEEHIKSGQNEVSTRKVHMDKQVIETSVNGSVVSSAQHGLGVVPVVYFPAVKIGGKQTIQPSSGMEPLAITARVMYNYDSFLEEILRKQTFSILTMPTTDKGSLDIGVSNAIAYDPNATNGAKPEFISPPSDPAKVLMDKKISMVQEMYRMAGLSFVNESAADVSGVSRQWEFERTNQALAAFALQCQKAEMSIIGLFEKWMNIDVDYNVEYAKDFGIVDMMSELQSAQAVLDMNLAAGIKVEVLKKVMGTYLPDLPSDRYDELVDEAEQEETDQMHAEPPFPPATMPPDNEETITEE